MKKMLNLSTGYTDSYLLHNQLRHKKITPKILVFGKTKGFYHTSIPKGMLTIMNICGQDRNYG